MDTAEVLTEEPTSSIPNQYLIQYIRDLHGNDPLVLELAERYEAIVYLMTVFRSTYK